MKNCMYDKEVEYDVSKLPLYVQEIIRICEDASDKGDFITYDSYSSGLEAHLKNLLLAHKLSDRDYSILLRKYGGYID